MFAQALLCPCLMAAAAIGHVIRDTASLKFACGTPEPTEEELVVAAQFAAEEAAGNFTARATIEVDTYMHSIGSSSSDLLSSSDFQAQVDVLNEDFAPHGIEFILQGTTATVNSNWAADRSELSMKRSLRQGGYDALNIYFLSDMPSYLGYAYFPQSTSSSSTAFYRDGCTILSSTVPGGSFAPYNLGRTATHEVGHWFGLYHTFQSGCSGSGDYIDDTPPQDSFSSGCPIGRDSCSGGGVDPIHNYMDYSDDDCYEEFTSGQQTRMYSQYNTYRA